MQATTLADAGVCPTVFDIRNVNHLIEVTSDYLPIMKAIGVKELKARLSEYLRAVRRGETLLVTDRSEVIAELRPAGRRPGAPETLDSALDALAESGDVARARVAKQSWRWKPVGLGLSARAATEIMGAVRGERDE